MADSRSRAHHSRGRHPSPLTTASVTVTATAVNGAEVDCTVTGEVATNNAVFVSQSVASEITFDLVDQTSQSVKFDTNNPFGSQNNNCPKANPQPKPKPPCSLGSPAPTENCFTMSIAPTNGRAVSYYRLNFQNGLSSDPIIIHE